MKVTFGNFEFDGLRIKRYEKYPWANPEERKAFFGKLHDENTNYNKEKWIRFSEKEAGELIHVNLSKSYVLRALSIFCIILMMVSVPLVFGFIGLSCLGGSYIFNLMAKKNWKNLQMDYMMADMLF